MTTITRPRRSRLHRKEHQAALLFVAIPVIGFLLFTLFPLLFSVYASFTNWNGISAPVFKGLDNYTKMFGDRYFLKSLWNTLFMMIGIPIGLVISLALALAMNRKMRGTTFFRTVYYLPVISSIAAVAILFLCVFLIVRRWFNKASAEHDGSSAASPSRGQAARPGSLNAATSAAFHPGGRRHTG